jgi:hypothetical protein
MIIFFSAQAISCRAQSNMQIGTITPIDIYGKTNFYLNRGFPFNLTVELNSPSGRDYLVTATLYDANNVPSGYASSINHLSTGTNVLTLTLVTTTYAFVGLADLHVAIFNPDHSPVASRDQTVAIQILGDFDKDGSVSAKDITFFITGYNYYWYNPAVFSLKYRVCDINQDGKMDFRDIADFVNAYTCYWSNQ